MQNFVTKMDDLIVKGLQYSNENKAEEVINILNLLKTEVFKLQTKLDKQNIVICYKKSIKEGVLCK